MSIGWIVVLVVVIYIFASLKVVPQWEEMVILSLGRFTGIRGPGLTVVWAFFQTGIRIDRRIVTTEFRADGTLSRDKVPVTLLAVLFWRVTDAERAALHVQRYRSAIDLAAQTTLRDVVSRNDLETLLSNRQELDEQIAAQIRERAASWGIEVLNVEIRDLQIPDSLQEMLSRKAQAQAEKEARRIYGEAEVVAAEEYLRAADLYARSPIAFRLRGLNVLLEAVQSDRNTLLFLPTELMDVLRGLGSAGRTPQAP